MNQEIHSVRRLDSTFQFSMDLEDSSPTVTVKIWEALDTLNPATKYEAELSHTIQNSKQAEPYTPMREAASAKEAFNAVVAGFLQMFDGPTTKVVPRKDF